MGSAVTRERGGRQHTIYVPGNITVGKRTCLVPTELEFSTQKLNKLVSKSMQLGHRPYSNDLL